MNILVAGGSGFVGSHVADVLSEAGHRVTIFDLQPYDFLRPDLSLQGDMLDPEDAAKAVEGQEVVYNFAGMADIEECRSRPVDTVRVNTLGNAVLLDAARQAGVGRYVFASTIYVYGESGGFYRVSKQASELLIEEYQRQFGLDYTVLRYGTLYGRRADERNSVHRYLKQALVDRKIVCYGTGDELREYIHVEDAARSSVEILAEEFRNEYVILTGHYPMRFRDLVLMIREMVGDDVIIEYRPSDTEASDPKHNPQSRFTRRPYSGYTPAVGRERFVAEPVPTS